MVKESYVLESSKGAEIKKYGFFALLMILTGCASHIMGGFIGKPLTVVIAQYGFPVGAYDIDKNKRAFVWQKSGAVVVPGSSFTTGTAVGNQLFATTYSSPAYANSFTCAYVLYADKNQSGVEGPASWTVVGFEKPKLGCE